MLAVALAAALAGLAVVLLTGTAPRLSATPPVARAQTHPAVSSRAHKPPAGQPTKSGRASALPPAAAAAATLVGDLQAAVADGQVARPAGQDLFNHLQQLLFGPPNTTLSRSGSNTSSSSRLTDQHRSQGQITGPAAASLRRDLSALGAALGAT